MTKRATVAPATPAAMAPNDATAPRRRRRSANGRARLVPRPPQSLRLSSGAEARIERGDDGERLEVRSPRGELLFEYDPAARVTRVHVPEGDLRLVADQGDIDLQAAGRVRLTGKQALELQAGDGAGARSGLRLRERDVALSGERVDIAGRLGRLALAELDYRGEQFRGALDEARLTATNVVTVADTVRHVARRVYENVEGLMQSQVGRLRTLVGDAYHLKARRLVLKSDRDAKIMGEKIHLG